MTIPVLREKNKVRIALAIPTGAPIILGNEIIYTPPLIALKTIIATYLLNFLLHDFL